MRGRKPKPVAFRENPKNATPERKIKENEPAFPSFKRAPSPPDHLNEHAAAEWRRMCPILIRAGLFTAADIAALTLYCEAWGRLVDANLAIEKTGMLIKTTNGNVIQNPHVGIANRAWEQVRKILTEFGLTPSSRARLHWSLGERPEIRTRSRSVQITPAGGGDDPRKILVFDKTGTDD